MPADFPCYSHGMKSRTVGSLCTGYGGLEMAAGLPALWHAEINSHASRVLKRRWPDVPNLGDLTAVDWNAVRVPDLLLAGFPCQSASVAGHRRGRADARWLWPAVATAIGVLRPSEILIENVPNLRNIDGGHAFHDVLCDLARLGYAARWTVVGACAVGLAHHRHRLFLRALPASGCRAPDAQAWPMAGRVVRGELIAEPTPACGAPPLRMKTLPTPGTASEPGTAGRRSSEGYRPQLGQVILGLFPTPRANDGNARSRGADHTIERRESEGRAQLADVAQLFPSPRSTDGVNGGPGQRGSKGDLVLPSAVQPGHFGRYADAVRRHVATTGTFPPAPTEPNGNGEPRLSPAFAEWLMDLPAGWVTDELDRLPALTAIGNGVVPRQVRHAYKLLSSPPS
jgi:DNA (cytosine-5)-methyltransferase 1